MERETGWSKELLYQLVDQVKDYAIFVNDLEGRIVTWNKGAEKLFGYTPAEVIGQDMRILYTPEDRADRIPEKEMETSVREGCADDERWHIRKDASRFFASGVQTPLYDRSGNHTGYAKIARDLTERIVAQDELRKAYESVEEKIQERTNGISDSNEALRLEIVQHREAERLRSILLRRIVKAQEEERKRIARDIHDNIGQQMTALQLRLKLLLDKYEQDPSIAGDLAELQSIADRIDSDADFLAWELRPSVLDDLGLAAATEKFLREWSEHFGVSGEFAKVGLDGDRLLPECEINLYRIAQEALNNISKHARATHVSVLLERRDNIINLIIEDNGKGFVTSREAVFTGDDRGIGLLSMKERAELIGGTFEIESTAGGGTTVFVRIPARFDETSGDGTTS